MCYNYFMIKADFSNKIYYNIDKGIEISVSTRYIPERSNIQEDYYFFEYTVTIKNTNPFRVRVMNRKWNISDFTHNKRSVANPGVNGQRPFLEPNEEYVYSSYCPFDKPFGFISGGLDLENAEENKQFFVTSPTFFFQSYNAKDFFKQYTKPLLINSDGLFHTSDSKLIGFLKQYDVPVSIYEDSLVGEL